MVGKEVWAKLLVAVVVVGTVSAGAPAVPFAGAVGATPSQTSIYVANGGQGASVAEAVELSLSVSPVFEARDKPRPSAVGTPRDSPACE